MLGNRPHGLQPVVADDHLIAAFALGTFVFDQDWSMGTRQSVLLEVGFTADRFLGYRLRPVVIRHNYQPELVDPAGSEGREILTRVWEATDARLFRELAATGDVTDPPAGLEVAPLADLSAEAADVAAGTAGSVSVAVIDLARHILYVSGAQSRYPLASVAKVPLFLATFERAPDPARQRLANAMITQSDNAAADALWTAVGGRPAVMAVWERAGGGSERVFYGDHWGAVEADARSVAFLFQAIVAGAFADDVSTAAQMALESVVPDQAWGVGARAPVGWTVGLKNGWLPYGDGWLVHSAGYLKDTTGAPRAIIVVLMGTTQASIQGSPPSSRWRN